MPRRGTPHVEVPIHGANKKTLLRMGMQGHEKSLTPVPFLEGQDVDDGSGPGLP